MARIVSLLLAAGLLAACQTTVAERPRIPPGASADDENRILCRLPQSSPWFVPCNDAWN